MNEPFDISIHEGIAVWTLNLPQVGNAITNAEVIAAFEAAVDSANSDADVRVVILTGAGHIFSAGGNVREMADEEGLFGLDAVEQRHGYADGIQRIPRSMQRCEVPVIAAVNGAAIGAGCDLAMMCDIRIASEKAFFAESFVQLGLIPGDGGSWLLQRAIGYERAAEMTFTGDRVDAATAREWGLVSRVVPEGELIDEAMALAARIAKNPPHALRMAKRLLTESRTSSLDSALSLAAAMQPLAHQTSDHKERVARWAKR